MRKQQTTHQSEGNQNRGRDQRSPIVKRGKRGGDSRSTDGLIERTHTIGRHNGATAPGDKKCAQTTQNEQTNVQYDSTTKEIEGEDRDPP